MKCATVKANFLVTLLRAYKYSHNYHSHIRYAARCFELQLCSRNEHNFHL